MSGEDGQTPPTVSDQIDQTVTQDQLQQVVQALSPIAGLGMAANNAAERAGAMAGNAGGRYSFSPDEIQPAINAFQDVAHKAAQLDRQLSVAAAQINLAPADDGPSQRQASAVQESLDQARRHNSALAQYAQKYLAKLQAAKKKYEFTEGVNVENAQRQM